MMIKRMLVLVAAGILTFTACSDDSLPPVGDGSVADGAKADGAKADGAKADGKKPGDDQGPGTDGKAGDGGKELSCTGKPDGTSCSPAGGLICVGGSCVPTSCGDGYVDKAAGEECEDNNDVPDDGCGFCKWNCKAPADCDDTNDCTTDTCDTTSHKCSNAAVATGTKCKDATGAAGVCNGATCGKAGCGNGVKDAGEECDDGNKKDGDGCDNNCKFSCKANTDCDDGSLCTGKETCDTTKHVCVAGKALNCDDKKSCTADSCDPKKGCINTPIDKDGDKHSCDQDCDDNDASVYKGAPEYCDKKDNDCDGLVDEGATKATCYVDSDLDSYAPSVLLSIQRCVCPKGYTTRKPAKGSTDCWDRSGSISPAQKAWFSKAYCKKYLIGTNKCISSTWDYNCSGASEMRYTAVYTKCKASFRGCTGSGWKGSVPACGVTGTYYSCYSAGFLNCRIRVSNVTQSCH